jgi:hypothetical protein
VGCSVVLRSFITERYEKDRENIRGHQNPEGTRLLLSICSEVVSESMYGKKRLPNLIVTAAFAIAAKNVRHQRNPILIQRAIGTEAPKWSIGSSPPNWSRCFFFSKPGVIDSVVSLSQNSYLKNNAAIWVPQWDQRCCCKQRFCCYKSSTREATKVGTNSLKIT